MRHLFPVVLAVLIVFLLPNWETFAQEPSSDRPLDWTALYFACDGWDVYGQGKHQEHVYQQEMQAEAEKQLRAAGITLLTKEEVERAPGMPTLSIGGTAVGGKDGAPYYGTLLTLKVDERGMLERVPAQKRTVTVYESTRLSTVTPENIPHLQNRVTEIVHDFVARVVAHQKAHPTK
jgi:hypothetical protein